MKASPPLGGGQIQFECSESCVQSTWRDFPVGSCNFNKRPQHVYFLGVLVGVSSSVKRLHDHRNSYKMKRLVVVTLLQFQRFSPLSS